MSWQQFQTEKITLNYGYDNLKTLKLDIDKNFT